MIPAPIWEPRLHSPLHTGRDPRRARKAMIQTSIRGMRPPFRSNPSKRSLQSGKLAGTLQGRAAMTNGAAQRLPSPLARRNAFGSVLVIATAFATLSCARSATGPNDSAWRFLPGRVETLSLPAFREGRLCWVYLPPDYAASGRRYPVLYMSLTDSFSPIGVTCPRPSTAAAPRNHSPGRARHRSATAS